EGGPQGQDHWSQHYPYCGGALQSPIDLKSDLLRFDPTLRPIEVQNYNLSPNEQLTLGNNGHSGEYTSTVLSKEYVRRAIRCKMILTYCSFCSQLHLVHYNSDKYPNISTAVDKSDGLAVLGVLLISVLSFRLSDQKVKVPAFNIRALLPTRLDEYYRYDGSLTTPPCYPSVLWTVFRNPITVSRQQLELLLYRYEQRCCMVGLKIHHRPNEHPVCGDV
uniref:Carbonic anhydrase XII n=1 Tax=Haplochromis burtoni TaxID=8153 RepID=A0A3Q2WTK2_HAPBU